MSSYPDYIHLRHSYIIKGMSENKLIYFAGAEICLENTVYHDVGEIVQVCAVIRSPEVTCPIQFAFNIILSTVTGMSPIVSSLKLHYP